MLKPSALLPQAVRTSGQIYSISAHTNISHTDKTANLELLPWISHPDFYLKTYITLFTLLVLTYVDGKECPKGIHSAFVWIRWKHYRNLKNSSGSALLCWKNGSLFYFAGKKISAVIKQHHLKAEWTFIYSLVKWNGSCFVALYKLMLRSVNNSQWNHSVNEAKTTSLCYSSACTLHKYYSQDQILCWRVISTEITQ